MKKHRHLRIAALAVIIVSCALFALSYRYAGRTDLRYVKRAIDGDTILLANGDRVRYIGINTPETKHPYKPVEYFGKEASDYNKRLVESKWVRLEYDVERRDRYGRLLAYVFLDDLFINAKMVKEGYAQVYTVPPNVKHQELFLKLQREARENGRGLWGGP
jgi:micrococcal nuclease